MSVPTANLSLPPVVSSPVNASTHTNGSTSTNSSTHSASAAPPFNASDLVFNVDIFLLCIVAVFFLLLLPRAAIRFTHKREWVDGHFLRSQDRASFPSLKASSRTQNDRVLARQLAGRNRSSAETADAVTVDSFHSSMVPVDLSTVAPSSKLDLDSLPQYGNWSDLERARSTAKQRYERRANAPTHMPGWSTMLSTLASRLRITVHPGLTIGKGIILLGYFAVLLYAGLYGSNPFTDPVRAAYVAASQLPVVIIFGTKTNLLGMLIGFGYERLNYLHRFAGRMFVLSVNVHAIGFLYNWTLNGHFARNIANPNKQWAFVALITADLLFLLSADAVRSKLYNAVFIPSHVILVIVLFVAISQHSAWALPYILIAVAVYGLDRVTRLAKSRMAEAKITQLDGLGMTKVVIEDINAGWRAGQHIRLRVWSSGMGWRRMMESHPFTIASVSRDAEGNGLVLMVKKAGDWTNKLYTLAKPPVSSPEPYSLKHSDAKRGFPDPSRAERGYSLGDDKEPEPVRLRRVIIEGPYGGPGHAIFSSFTGAMFVAGGSGITFALASVEDLVKKDLHEHSCIRALQLVWCVQDPIALKGYALAKFKELLKLAHRKYADLEITVFYTRAPADRDVLNKLGPLPPGLSLSPCRPDFAKVLERLVDRTQRQSEDWSSRSKGRRSEDNHRSQSSARRDDWSEKSREHHHRQRSHGTRPEERWSEKPRERHRSRSVRPEDDDRSRAQQGTDANDDSTRVADKDKTLRMTGVIVGVCGPASLGDGVRKAVAAFPAKKRNRVGGIELHEEAFGW